MEISVVGISHRTAPVDVREQFALPDGLAAELLRAIKADGLFEEALVLDTCNRTEVYLVAKEPQDCLGCVLGHLARLKGIPPTTDTSLFYRRDALTAVAHLFRVAASLESQIVGEDQIADQVRDAYRRAADERSTGFVLNRLLHRAIHVGKEVRTKTELNRGAASIPYAAVELAGQIFSTLAGKTVLLVGAGKTAELAARNVIAGGVSHMIVANRTPERARQMATELLESTAGAPCPLSSESAASSQPSPRASPGAPTAHAIGLDDIPSVISKVDLVICSTGSSDVVLTYDSAGRILRKNDRPVFIIDIAVPRDVDPRLNTLSNVFLYNIDDLNRLVAANIERRRQEMPRAQAIVESEVEAFGKWLDSLQVVPIVKLLQQRVDILRRAEVKKYGGRFSDADSEQLEVFTRSLCRKILREPVAFLHRIAQGHESEAVIDIIRRMFDLDSPEKDQ